MKLYIRQKKIDRWKRTSFHGKVNQESKKYRRTLGSSQGR